MLWIIMAGLLWFCTSVWGISLLFMCSLASALRGSVSWNLLTLFMTQVFFFFTLSHFPASSSKIVQSLCFILITTNFSLTIYGRKYPKYLDQTSLEISIRHVLYIFDCISNKHIKLFIDSTK